MVTKPHEPTSKGVCMGPFKGDLGILQRYSRNNGESDGQDNGTHNFRKVVRTLKSCWGSYETKKLALRP